MVSMVEQHTLWLELCAAGQKGEEFDWRTAELLSCLRSIEVGLVVALRTCAPSRLRTFLPRTLLTCRPRTPLMQWDLQDLEDAVSIIKGNRQRFSALDDTIIASRNAFIDAMRAKVDGARSSIDNAPASSDGGHASNKKSRAPAVALPNTAAAKGYGKLKENEAANTCSETSNSHAVGFGSASTISEPPGAPPCGEERAHSRRARWWAWCC
mmetsp:Transcript_64256/g.126965  ORF Transcript_64256/g.126965 Transcript_64256/m.126965 type:complete len:211 (-) Transcript_64256:84-716(-)